MRHSIRATLSVIALVAAGACSKGASQPALSDDLKSDLASVGAGDVQLASNGTSRLEVVSAAERSVSPTPAPKAPAVSKAPSAARSTKAVVRSVRREQPVAAPAQVEQQPAPVQERIETPAPEPVPSQARPSAPPVHTNREPPGGWRTPGQVIRNAPFPINP